MFTFVVNQANHSSERSAMLFRFVSFDNADSVGGCLVLPRPRWMAKACVLHWSSGGEGDEGVGRQGRGQGASQLMPSAPLSTPCSCAPLRRAFPGPTTQRGQPIIPAAA